MLRKYTPEDLNTEIDRHIDAAHDREQPAHPGWITHKICREHINGLALDADQSDMVEPLDVAYWRYGGYTNTRHAVTARINQRERTQVNVDDLVEGAREPFLPGYEFLQRRYVIVRDGVSVEVLTEQMTVAELLAKADQYDANATTMSRHAEELRRYAAQRAEQVS
jgi:hypothetical protein